MVIKLKTQRGPECDAVSGKVDERGCAIPVVHSAWAASGSAIVGSLGSAVRTAPPFSMKGGYVGSGSQRRLVIFGKIGRF